MTYTIGQTVTHNNKEWKVDAAYDDKLRLVRGGKYLLVPKQAVGEKQSTQAQQIVMK